MAFLLFSSFNSLFNNNLVNRKRDGKADSSRNVDMDKVVRS
jgi:hypothetical protein